MFHNNKETQHAGENIYPTTPAAARVDAHRASARPTRRGVRP